MAHLTGDGLVKRSSSILHVLNFGATDIAGALETVLNANDQEVASALHDAGVVGTAIAQALGNVYRDTD